jgi:hypothetical protein
MRRGLAIVVVWAACGGKSPPPPNNAIAKTAVSITGTVTDENKAPLEGVTVIVNPAGRWAETEGRPPEGEKPLAETLTNAKGTYAIALAAGRYDVRFYYADIVVHRVSDVHGPTTVDQQIDGRWTSSGIQRHCADGTAASCK